MINNKILLKMSSRIHEQNYNLLCTFPMVLILAVIILLRFVCCTHLARFTDVG